MGTLTITELGERTGRRSSALRFYERKGLIHPIGRAGGKRVYEDRCVEQVAFIDLLKTSGFTLSEIAALIDTEGRVEPDWRARAVAKHDELGELIDEMERARTMLHHIVECPHPSLHDCPTHRQIVSAHAAGLARRH